MMNIYIYKYVLGNSLVLQHGNGIMIYDDTYVDDIVMVVTTIIMFIQRYDWGYKVPFKLP